MIPDIFKYVVIRSDLIKYVYSIITGNIQTRKPSYGSFTLSKNEIFTAGQRNWGKVMFSQVFVSHSVHNGVVSLVPCPFKGISLVPGPFWATHPHPLDMVYNGIRSASARYASYWNAFLFLWSLSLLNMNNNRFLYESISKRCRFRFRDNFKQPLQWDQNVSILYEAHCELIVTPLGVRSTGHPVTVHTHCTGPGRELWVSKGNQG